MIIVTVRMLGWARAHLHQPRAIVLCSPYLLSLSSAHAVGGYVTWDGPRTYFLSSYHLQCQTKAQGNDGFALCFGFCFPLPSFSLCSALVHWTDFTFHCHSRSAQKRPPNETVAFFACLFSALTHTFSVFLWCGWVPFPSLRVHVHNRSLVSGQTSPPLKKRAVV